MVPERVGQNRTVHQLVPPGFVFHSRLADSALLADDLQYSMAVAERKVVVMMVGGWKEEAVILVRIVEPT